MEISGPQWLRASTLPLFQRWAIWSMAFVSRRLSPPILSTTVDYASRGHENEVLHTSTISHLGITLFRSQETIFLENDDRSFRMTGTMSFFPRLGKKVEWAAHGAVAIDHDSAVYHIPFFGEVLEQRTRMTSQGLEMVQSTPFFRASILLQWQRLLSAQ